VLGPVPLQACFWGPVALVLALRIRHGGSWANWELLRRDGKEDSSGDDVDHGDFRRSDDIVLDGTLRRTLRRGTASDFAWPFLPLLSVGLAGWFANGTLRHDLVIVISNGLVLGSVLVVISVKLRSRPLTFDQVELAVPAGADPVAALESLVDIGPRLAADVRKIGIADAPALRTVGIEEANRRLVESGLQTGVHSRRAIRKAIL
jgi:hypothetical protein